MALHLDPPDRDRSRKVRTGGLGGELRLAADGVAVLAHGALVCPCCALPLDPAPRLAAGRLVSCPWCAHSARAHEFLAYDVYDTVANEAYLVARLV